MSNHLASDAPAADAARSTRSPHVGWAAAAVVVTTVALALSGCGARAARHDATPTTSTTAPTATASTSSTGAAPTATVPTDDVEQDLSTVQSDLDGAAKDLSDGQTEATTDTRG